MSDSRGFNKQLKMLMQSDQSAISSQGVAQKLHHACRHGRDNFGKLCHFYCCKKSFCQLLRMVGHQDDRASNLFPDKMCQESNMSSCRGAAVSRHLATRLSEHVRVLERGHNTRKRWNQNILFGTFSTWVCLIVGTPSTNTSGGGAVLSNDMIKVNLRETHTEEALSGHQRYITHWACLKASPWCLLVY